MTRSHFSIPLVAFAALVSIAGCKSCRHDDDASARGDAATAVGSGAPSAPYLPARTVPDDSPAPESQVEGVLVQLRPDLRSCYRSAALDDPKLEGKIIFKVTIAPDGKVTEILLDGKPEVDQRLIDCMRRVVARAKFSPPPGGRSASVMVPLEFKPPPIREAGTQ